MVRAKFKVSSAIRRDGYVQVELFPVYSDDENSENKRFWNATPSGNISMSITNSAAADEFVEGQEYYVDFTIADS